MNIGLKKLSEIKSIRKNIELIFGVSIEIGVSEFQHVSVSLRVSFTMFGLKLIFCSFFFFESLLTYSEEEFYLDNRNASIHYIQHSMFTKFILNGSYPITVNITLTHSRLNPKEISSLSTLTELRNIQLYNNNMCCRFDFKYVSGCTKLVTLLLDKNNLKMIKNSLENSLLNLEMVNLNYNSIKVISMKSFEKMPRLRYLGLSHNKITRIENYSKIRSIIPLIHTMPLDGNQLYCDELTDLLYHSNMISPQIHFLARYTYIYPCNSSKFSEPKIDFTCCRIKKFSRKEKNENITIPIIENQTIETQTSETQTIETQTIETQTSETQTSETQTSETQTSETSETQTIETSETQTIIENITTLTIENITTPTIENITTPTIENILPTIENENVINITRTKNLLQSGNISNLENKQASIKPSVMFSFIFLSISIIQI